MHRRVYSEFESLCRSYRAGGAVLEIGAMPNSHSLLCMQALNGSATSKVGIDLNGPHEFSGFQIIKGNANKMEFADHSFDTVLCNAVLEHDPKFWQTLSEMRRVTRPGGLIVIGVPGYRTYAIERLKDRVLAKTGLRAFVARTVALNPLASSTVTFRVHLNPHDYYRFSEMAVRNVFFDGMEDVSVRSVMVPPRIIAAGRMP